MASACCCWWRCFERQHVSKEALIGELSARLVDVNASPASYASLAAEWRYRAFRRGGFGRMGNAGGKANRSMYSVGVGMCWLHYCETTRGE